MGGLPTGFPVPTQAATPQLAPLLLLTDSLDSRLAPPCPSSPPLIASRAGQREPDLSIERSTQAPIAPACITASVFGITGAAKVAATTNTPTANDGPPSGA